MTFTGTWRPQESCSRSNPTWARDEVRLKRCHVLRPDWASLQFCFSQYCQDSCCTCIRWPRDDVLTAAPEINERLIHPSSCNWYIQGSSFTMTNVTNFGIFMKSIKPSNRSEIPPIDVLAIYKYFMSLWIHGAKGPFELEFTRSRLILTRLHNASTSADIENL